MNFKIGFRYLGLLEMFSFVTVEILNRPTEVYIMM